MEYCPYESAFDILPKKEEKRKKRAKMDMSFLDKPITDDSDYPPVVGSKSDLLSLQKFSEAFVDVPNNIPVPPVNQFQPLPKYFTGETEDEGFTDVIGTKEVITPQNTLPTFETSADFNNDDVNINDGWKPVTRSNTYTAFYDTTTPSLSQMKKERQNNKKDTKDTKESSKIIPLKELSDTTDNSNELVKKIDTLFERLNALEKECKGDINQNNQKEILMFVGTGFVFLIGLHLLRR